MTKEEQHSFAASEGELRNALEWLQIAQDGLSNLETSKDATVALRAHRALRNILTARVSVDIALRHSRGES